MLRPAAIYGPGEERHFPRIIEVMDRYILYERLGTCIYLVCLFCNMHKWTFSLSDWQCHGGLGACK